MKPLAKKVLGFLNLAMALTGAGLTAIDLTTHMPMWQTHPVAFPVMLVCSLVLLGILVVTGILLIRDSGKALRFGLFLYAAEIIYFIVAASIPATGGAFAVANVGLFPQLVTAFPIWALMTIWWCSRKSPHEKQVQGA